MLDITAERSPDRRPAIVICAYDPQAMAWDAYEDLSGLPWSPTGARTVPVDAQAFEDLAGTLAEHLSDRDCRAVLLVGPTRKADQFRIQMRAENRAPSGRKLTQTGPGSARSTVPAAEMVRALNDAGLAAEATSDGEDDAGSALLYSVLVALPEGVDTPAVGLLRVPVGTSADTVGRGVKTAAGAIARHLSPLPRQPA
jgi:pyrrolidone-carboxylate peptidase